MNLMDNDPCIMKKRVFCGASEVQKIELDLSTNRKSTILFISSIPSIFALTDVSTKIKRRSTNVKGMRICLSEDSRDFYSVIVLFDSIEGAEDFIREGNEVRFSSFQQEPSLVFFINEAQKEETMEPHFKFSGCPVCLENVKEDDPLITTLCCHVFHTQCLSQWEDERCPLCRYVMTTSSDHCDMCCEEDDLHMCLICGFVGCGTEEGSHAYEHFENTGHAYSVELDSQRVWDFSGGGFVHRLVQNRVDGKIVEVPDPFATSDQRDEAAVSDEVVRVTKDRLKGLAGEYSNVLNQQLICQRQYFQRELRKSEEGAQLSTMALEEGRQVLTENRLIYKEEQNEILAHIKAIQAESKLLNEKMEKLRDERSFIENLNSSLDANQVRFPKELEKLQKESDQIQSKQELEIAALQNEIDELMEKLG
eukprot:TRINITY_DN54281_c0_g1_i1.p1 TRINITY_DN54281_c0_g1~~TRINITY_DN54281_c0_g1_i1.p1  ORF type:complete len:422 (+),score=108.80 TRINITY_DN54281_c0_g1_i1:137-1402(+)